MYIGHNKGHVDYSIKDIKKILSIDDWKDFYMVFLKDMYSMFIYYLNLVNIAMKLPCSKYIWGTWQELSKHIDVVENSMYEAIFTHFLVISLIFTRQFFDFDLYFRPEFTGWVLFYARNEVFDNPFLLCPKAIILYL